MGDAADAARSAPERATTFEVTLPRGRVRYRDLGPSSKTPVVFLHGLGLDGTQWMEVAPPLALGRRVLIPDLPGAGGSPSARVALSLRELAETVVDLVAAVGASRVTLVGQDTGAALALVLATEWPEFVERLVLVAPPVFPRAPRAEERAALLPVLGRALFRRGLGRFVLAKRDARPAQIDDGTLPLLRETSDRASLFARLPRVRCSTLLIFGREDPIEPWTQGQRLARELGRAHLEVLDGRHRPERDEPARFVRVLTRFLGEAAP